MSPIEVMARAICRTVLARLVASDRLDAVVNEEWHGHVLEATAALLALSQMEPTPEMELEGKSVSWCTGENGFSENCVNCSEVFRAMIAAAVKEGE